MIRMLAEKKNNFNLIIGFALFTALFVAGGACVATLPDNQPGVRGVFITAEILLYLLCLAGGALFSLAAQRKELIIAGQNAVALHKKQAEHMKQILDTQSRILGNASNMQVALQMMVTEIRELIDAEGCAIEMLEGEEIINYAASGSSRPFVGQRMKAEGSLSGLCIKTGSVLKCDDSEIDERVNKEVCRKTKVRSMVMVPLSHHGSRIGALMVKSSRRAAFNEDHVATLELMAGLLSATLSDVIMANTLRLNNLELNAVNMGLQEMATTDGLTGLQNRRTFQEFLSREHDLAARHRKQLSLVIMDVDHFKQYNDSFGHPAGDAVLQKVGAVLKQVARKTDCAARYGGEEFVLLLPETGFDEAMVIASRIQQTVANEKWKHRPVTVSVGVSSLGDGISNAMELLETADKALYTAKEGGRNRVVRFAR